MRTIPLEQLPKQRLTCTLDGVNHAITIIDTGGGLAVTIARTNVTLLDNVRVVGNTWLLPYIYLEYGNFAFITTDGESIPDWRDFGATCNLVYVPQSEVLDA